MIHSSKRNKKVQLSFEPAFQIIYFSVTSICFCLAIIFATTIQQFNWYTVIFLFLGIILAYFKRGTHVRITDHSIECTYFRGIKEKAIGFSELEEVILSKSTRKVTLKQKSGSDQNIYLNQSNKKLLVEWMEHTSHLINIRYIN